MTLKDNPDERISWADVVTKFTDIKLQILATTIFPSPRYTVIYFTTKYKDRIENQNQLVGFSNPKNPCVHLAAFGISADKWGIV
jgi:hypothetical protein